MKNADLVVAVVREWVVKAENDLLNATHTLKLGKRCPTDTAEARRALAAARRVRKAVRALLPRRALRRVPAVR